MFQKALSLIHIIRQLQYNLIDLVYAKYDFVMYCNNA